MSVIQPTNNNQPSTDDLKLVQSCELEIMKYIHNFCEQNHLRYSLAYGTAIGAVRHHGFIPWDDDIDIVMPREDYNRFLSLWKNSDDYILVNKDTNPDFTQNFTKIKKNHTTFLQVEDVDKSYHKGIFVDIFVADRIPDSTLRRKKLYLDCLISLLFTRNHNSDKGGPIQKIENAMLSLSDNKKKAWLFRANRNIQKFNTNTANSYIILSTLPSCKIIYPNDIFSELVLTDFENEEFYIFKQSDLHLKLEYGDYMKLPPEEDRVWKHHPVLIDFTHNYEEI